MSAAPVSRAIVLRQSRFALRRTQFRNASTTSEAASKAKDTASNTVSKASEGLSKVSASASSAVTGAASTARTALGKVGGRTGRLIKFVDGLIPPTIYYSRVGLELGKAMWHGQKMAPPSLQQFQAYGQTLVNLVRNPQQISSAASSIGSTPESFLQSLRNINRDQVTAYGIVGAQLLGFFTLGNMIGRLKVVGYHGEVHHEH